MALERVNLAVEKKTKIKLKKKNNKKATEVVKSSVELTRKELFNGDNLISFFCRCHNKTEFKSIEIKIGFNFKYTDAHTHTHSGTYKLVQIHRHKNELKKLTYTIKHIFNYQ